MKGVPFFLTLAGKSHLASFPNKLSHTSYTCFPNPTHHTPTPQRVLSQKRNQKERILYCQKLTPNAPTQPKYAPLTGFKTAQSQVWQRPSLYFLLKSRTILLNYFRFVALATTYFCMNLYKYALCLCQNPIVTLSFTKKQPTVQIFSNIVAIRSLKI